MDYNELIDKIIDIVPISAGEADISQNFLSVLTQFFQDNNFKSVIIHKEESSISGRSDARIGKIFIEFKKPNSLVNEDVRLDGYKKISGYIRDFIKKNPSLTSFPAGFITDGVLLREIKYDPKNDTIFPVDEFQKEIAIDKP
nr:hypothetical protein [Candidatus Sigynarchaeota archaeon]